MEERIKFLDHGVGGVRVIEEVLALMNPDINPGSYKECRELYPMIRALEKKLVATMRTDPWLEASGPSGGRYRIYISDEDPFVVYAAVRRQSTSYCMYVIYVGLRKSRNDALFYSEVSAEVIRRVRLQGWVL